MKAFDALAILEIGNSVAEFDRDLEKYFVETETFRAVIRGDVDIVAGDKGTGKTAIYRVLTKSYRSYPDLENVEIVSAFNVQGSPVFQRLTTQPVLSEGAYQTIWKAYILSLVGNWLVDIYGPTFNEEIKHLKNTLDHLDLSAADVSPETVFGNLMGLVRRLSTPSAAGVHFEFRESGLPVIYPKVEFGGQLEEKSIIYSDDFLSHLDAAIASTGMHIWVALDRLDEAFIGYPGMELPALRALLRSYLDLLGLKNLKLKLFVRKDLFRRITRGGFVNLTHVNAKKIEIVWDEADLLNMLCRRLRQSDAFLRILPQRDLGDEELFDCVFPEQVDQGKRKSTTFRWIMSRIRDGNDIKPPRNLIDIANKAREAQLRREARSAREIEIGADPIVEADSIKQSLRQLSEQRVQDTLLAEAGDLADDIAEFREGKSEHNAESIREVLRERGDVRAKIQGLLDLGFLEQFGQNFKIPMLYRDGLKITQGKAFATDGKGDEEEDE